MSNQYYGFVLNVGEDYETEKLETKRGEARNKPDNR
jgi:hypothetical protein